MKKIIFLFLSLSLLQGCSYKFIQKDNECQFCCINEGKKFVKVAKEGCLCDEKTK